ncbi:MAG TPA: efflux RND transporter periplasmic adaptor subunit [Kofleriaceae bacterium]|nr:efflux RND transporter periplasmic adaptor subunit [Kofleriaceae bacterium]
MTRHAQLAFVLALALAAACKQAGPQDQGNAEVLAEPLAQQASTADDPAQTTKPGYIGVLAPRESTEVVSPFTTKIAELFVKLGDPVQHGQPVARLDDRPLREQLAVETAALKEAQAEAAQAYVASRAAKAAFDREKRALAENVVSKGEVKNAEFDARKADMGAASAGARVEEQRAKIAGLKAKLTDTSVVAPLDGKVALLYVNVGDRVDEGHPVVRVISSDELFVKFAIPADQVGSIAAGDEVDIVIEQQGVTTPGVVRHVAPELDPVAQMILADAELTAPPAKLESGIVCRIVAKAKHAAKK